MATVPPLQPCGCVNVTPLGPLTLTRKHTLGSNVHHAIPSDKSELIMLPSMMCAFKIDVSCALLRVEVSMSAKAASVGHKTVKGLLGAPCNNESRFLVCRKGTKKYRNLNLALAGS